MSAIETRADWMDDRPREACGVVGVWMPERAAAGEIGVAQLAVMGMHGVQHRGYDGAGVFVADAAHGIPFLGNKGEGLVSQAIPDGGYHLDQMVPDARIAVGHVRYGTNKASGFDAAQPFHKDTFVLADNGHIEEIGQMLEVHGIDPAAYASDSEAKTVLLSQVSAEHIPGTTQRKGILRAIHEVAPHLEGAFSWVIATEDQLIGVRDPQGHRPLMLGHFSSARGFMLASEQGALREAGAAYLRDIEPGEVISISDAGVSSTLIDRKQSEYGGPCTLEYLYFARPDGSIQGRNIYEARKALGRLCAVKYPAEADIVVGIPDTSMSAALGFAEVSGIKLVPGIFRNPHVARSFMQATQDARIRAVRRKIRPNLPEVRGKRLVLVDDTIVRGTTIKETVSMMYAAGARAVHLRIPSAPLRNPCFQGIDIGDASTLLARQVPSVEAMRKELGVTSLAYLSVEEMHEAITSVAHDRQHEQAAQIAPLPTRALSALSAKLCQACMSGHYPITIPSKVKILSELT